MELGPAAKDICEKGFEDEDDESEGTTSAAAVDEPPQAAKHNLSSTGRSKEEQQRVRSLLRRGVDSLILACRYRPLPLLKLALCTLHSSSAFVVYHEFMEPLVECYLHLQQTGVALRMVLADTWWVCAPYRHSSGCSLHLSPHCFRLREFQTLPGRFRPEMYMPTSGGYVLSGIYVGTVPCPFPRPLTSSGKAEEDQRNEGAVEEGGDCESS